MSRPVTAKIPKVDFTATPHPSGVKALSLQDAPALIESLLPVQKLSIDVYRERMAGSGQTLTALGSYWKGRKPLVLNRACVLATLLPATDDPIKDLEVFELLMGMDDVSMSKRIGLAKPSDIVKRLQIQDISAYFNVDPPDQAAILPTQAPFNIEDYLYTKKGVARVTKLIWRKDVLEDVQHGLSAELLSSSSYKELAGAKGTARAEEIADKVSTHIWPKVNAHLGTRAFSFPDLVEQLGVMRFGHRPTVADTFSGSGQIPFAASQLGCDIYASDLNPVACMLTWAAFNLVGATDETLGSLGTSQSNLIAKVQSEIDDLKVEVDGLGWRGKAYLYCLEVRCPSSGWRVPVLPTFLVSKGKGSIVKLIPDFKNKRYDIVVKNDATSEELKIAARGTYLSGSVSHVVNGVEHVNSISAIRGDYSVVVSGKKAVKNRLRLWDKSDIEFSKSDVFSERLYAIQWIKDDGTARPQTEFRTVSSADIERELVVSNHVKEHLSEWQDKGWVPDLKIESGDKTDEPIRTRGWTYWHHLFNPRQLLVCAKARALCGAMDYPGLARVLNVSSRLCMWDVNPGPGRTGKTAGAFSSQSLNPLFVYGCRNAEWALELLATSKTQSKISGHFHIANHSAEETTEPFDICASDPPYGDAVKYEEILEFFIAWLRKNPPTEFANWIWDSRREIAVKGEDHSFRLSMVAAYKRMASCMPDNGIQILMFTHQDGNIWADMANIVWASGLRVTAAWYLVTETDSGLREGSYVKGTILLVLRKRLGAKRTNQTDLAYELEEEVAEQIRRLTGMNDSVVSDSKRAKDGNLFEDADLQMAGYAAALKVLTKYSIIDGKDMTQEALRPRVAGQTSLVEGLIEFAVNTANKALVPRGLAESVWHDLGPAERFYLKMLEQESHGLSALDNFQNFAKAFAVKNFGAMMANERANKAALRSAKEFGKTEMNQSSELFETPTRAVLYALMDLQAEKDLDLVLNGLEQNLKVGSYYSSRDALVAIARFIAKMLAVMRPEEASAARVLADGIANQRL